MRRIAIRIFNYSVLFIICFYLLLTCALYFKQNWYTPIIQKPLPSAYGANDAEIIRVKTSDGFTLDGWFFPPDESSKQIIVFFHGNGQNVGSMYSGVSQLRPYGYGLLMVEYRGYSGHEGVFNEGGFYIDSRTFMEWVKFNYPQVRLIVAGESMGTAGAIKMATEYDVDAVVIMGGFSSVKDVIQGMYPYFPVGLLLHDQWKNSDVVGNINAPLMVIHGANDGLVNVRYAKKLYDVAREPKEFILMEEAGHNDFFSHDATDRIIKFFDKYLLAEEN